MARFTKTVFLASPAQLSTVKIGNWVEFDSGIRGQYLGTTSHGTIVIRYQNDKFGKARDTEGNKLLRRYAVINGSK